MINGPLYIKPAWGSFLIHFSCFSHKRIPAYCFKQGLFSRILRLQKKTNHLQQGYCCLSMALWNSSLSISGKKDILRRGEFSRCLGNRGSSCGWRGATSPQLPQLSWYLPLQGTLCSSTKRANNKGPSSSTLHGCSMIPKITSPKELTFILEHGYRSFGPCVWPPCVGLWWGGWSA